MSLSSCLLNKDSADKKKIVLYSDQRKGKHKPIKYRYFTKDKKINEKFFEMIEEHIKDNHYGNLTQPKPEPTLWYSCGSSWFDKWTTEDIHGEYDMIRHFVSNKEIYSLELNMENILVVDTFDKLKKFNHKYGINCIAKY